MQYSAEEVRTYRETRISYGIMNGSKTIVLLKVGRGGNIYGENNSHPEVYLHLAQEINRHYGFTVIVSDNPVIETNPNPLIYDVQFVSEYADRFGFTDFSIVYVGFSAGANYGAWFGYLFPEIQRMLLIGAC